MLIKLVDVQICQDAAGALPRVGYRHRRSVSLGMNPEVLSLGTGTDELIPSTAVLEH